MRLSSSIVVLASVLSASLPALTMALPVRPLVEPLRVDTGVVADSTRADTTRVDTTRTSALPSTAGDTTPARAHKRPKAIEYSDWYGRRLTIHRWASYTMLPLFAVQYATGDALFKRGRAATTAFHLHKPVAIGIATLFTVNTVTGVWNLFDARKDPAGRTRRTIHSLLMLASDAGFVITGSLGKQAEISEQKRRLHRRVALTSMGISLVGYAIMLPPFRGND